MDRRGFLRLIAVTGAVTGAGLTLGACATEDGGGHGAGAGSGSNGEGGTVRVAAMVSPGDTLDPAAATSPGTWVGIVAVYDSLVVLLDNEPVPQLAESITSNDEADVWTVRLRPGATFSDGSPVTADDALASLVYTSASPMAGSFLAPLDADASRAVDEHTLELHLSAPRADFVEAVLAPQSAVFKGGDPQTGVGSGPFVLESGSAEDGWVFSPNPHHPGVGIDRLEVRSIPDPDARARAVVSGDVDYANDLPVTAARTVTDPARITEGGPADSKALGLILNTRVAPFDDENVRTAFKLLVDRESLVGTVLGQGAVVGEDVLGKGISNYPEDLSGVTRDVARARTLLEDAGVDELTLVTSDVVPGLNDAAELLVTQAREAGLTLTLDRRDPAAYFADIPGLMELPLFSIYWVNRSTATALPFTTGTAGGFNLDGFGADARWDRRLADAAAITDDAERQAAVSELAVEVSERGGQLIWGYQPFLNGTTDAAGDVPSSQSAPFFGSRPD
ncbi:ABC transporter substrate-binding protein [Dietzia sp. SLG310A2-38A2]|uniref:ABC transporter substrate-binding protein n=1 Tax=Dietzia sp. SLG310A2-38A2 TaxID=1630643 RepID=UPI0015FA3EE0|nr:ABC transporter substrate-binding protein [Dietzia sp. SLG310A2-38A2]MBB1030996.1 ABC transporter substrate-binding protein [Dietzia sp. SLG310A2-38A2]